MALGKMALAAGAGRHDEFRTDATILASTSADVNALVASALGPSSGADFSRAWATGDNARVDYIIGSVTHDGAKTEAAKNALVDSATQLSTAVQAALSPPVANIPKLESDEVDNFRNFVDEVTGGAYQTALSDLTKAQFASRTLARIIVGRIVGEFPDRFPGDPQSTAATLRANLASNLLAESYLLTALAGATIAAQVAEQDADRHTVTALDGNAIAGALAPLFGEATGAHLETVFDTLGQALAAYASDGDTANRQRALATAAPSTSPYGPDMTAAVSAVLQVVDDLRAKAYASVPMDDRAAAAEFATVADVLIEVATSRGLLP